MSDHERGAGKTWTHTMTRLGALCCHAGVHLFLRPFTVTAWEWERGRVSE